MIVSITPVQIEGGITAPQGYRACGIQAGIKKDKKDLALIVSDTPAAIAGVFTTNLVQSAPVLLCKQHLQGHIARAIVINSGNANACNGPRGLQDADRMAAVVAESLNLERQHVFVCSTGTIGVPMPMPVIEDGIRTAAGQICSSGGGDAATAILTTDTMTKQLAMRLFIDSKPVVIAGMAKGAGMINPRMATLLAFFTTDAVVEAEALQHCLTDAVERSFNRITVDGDRSTNDTALFMANGMAGNQPLNLRHPHWKSFRSAVYDLTWQLAMMIVKDGEGATKFVTVTVKGAVSKSSAKKVAETVANSLLVKTSWFGADPNWGRVIAAIGYSGAAIRQELIDIRYDGQLAVHRGMSHALSPETLRQIIIKKEFTIEIDLNLGKADYSVYTCDCSDQYVHINASYMT